MVDFQKLSQKRDRNQFIFNSAAADRILGLPAFSTLEVALEADDRVYVRTRDSEYKLPVNAFYRDFARSRQDRSRKLQVENHPDYQNVFMVNNPENHNCYPTRITATGIECKCRDYQKQQELIGGKHSCCKHGYAVLNYLGYSSLTEYLNSTQVTA